MSSNSFTITHFSDAIFSLRPYILCENLYFVAFIGKRVLRFLVLTVVVGLLTDRENRCLVWHFIRMSA